VQDVDEYAATFARQWAFFTCEESQCVERYVPGPRRVECQLYETLSMNVIVLSKLDDLAMMFMNQLELNEDDAPCPADQDDVL